MKINIVARKRFKINILTRDKLPRPSPAESNGRPLNFIVNVCFVRRICFGCFAWRTGWICRPLIEQTDAILQCSMSSIFDWEVRRLGMRDTLRRRTITVSGFGYFHKNCRFLWEKNVSKTNLGSTIHYIYTSYNKYFRLCMVSEELHLNEIGLFL